MINFKVHCVYWFNNSLAIINMEEQENIDMTNLPKWAFLIWNEYVLVVFESIFMWLDIKHVKIYTQAGIANITYPKAVIKQ